MNIVAPNKIIKLDALQQAQSLVQSEFKAVDDLILKSLHSRVSLIPEVGKYLLQAGGKRIRPLLLLLMAKACGELQKEHIQLAAMVEFLHSATLLHDDVVDDSSKRRGKPSANYVWDSATCILVGDFLYSRAYQIISDLRNFDITDILTDTINTMSEGEVLQLQYKKTPHLTEEQYYWIILCKTGKLFEAATLLGGTYQSHFKEYLQLGKFGLHLGCAFQLMDDLMDYQAHPDVMGKNIGDDLKEGKMTLPLLWALKHASPTDAQIIQESIETGTLKDLNTIQSVIYSTGAIEYTLKKAQEHAQKALNKLDILPESEYKTALINLTNFSIQRTS